MRINKSDPRLFKLWKESERRGLDYQILNPNLFAVESFSRPGHTHRVTVSGELLECSCEAAWSNLPCSHVAVVCAHLWPVTCWFQWSVAEDEEYAAKKLKKLAKIRARESKKTDRLVSALMPERKMAA